MNSLAFWIIAMFILGVTLAEDIASENQVIAEDESEGRSCYDCHGGDAYQNNNDGGGLDHSASQIHHYSAGNTNDLSWLWGMGGVALSVLPILAVNIVGVVLLAILLKHIGEPRDPIPYYQPAYAYSTYQTYDGGNTGYNSKPPTGSYNKRSTEEGRNFPSQSTLQFLTNVVSDAFHKYSNVDVEE